MASSCRVFQLVVVSLRYYAVNSGCMELKKGMVALDDTKNIENFSLYFDWVQKTCAEKDININEATVQVKDAKLFCISSDIGDLYFKKMTSFIVDELKFTLKLMELELVSQPEWIGYDHNMKVCLMRDMGGSDLSLLSQLDMETALNMLTLLSRIQKESVQYVKSEEFFGFDYKVSTMLGELRDLPESAYEMLSDTPYKITRSEAEKLKQNAEHVRIVLESIENRLLPNTIHHGDLGSYNVRIVDGKSIFYDWGCGGVSHPFFDTLRLLSAIRRKLPTDLPAKEIIVDAYLQEWLEYGSHEEIKDIFSAIDGLAGFYMAYVKYIRARNLHLSYTKKTEMTSTDAVGLDMRHETASIYLKRFLENSF